MLPGGITETIWHFSGYWHIDQDAWHQPTLYDGSAPQHGRTESTDSQRTSAGASPEELDDINSMSKSPPRWDATGDTFAHSFHIVAAPSGPMAKAGSSPVAKKMLPLAPASTAAGDAGSDGSFHYGMSYFVGSDVNKLLEIHQVNELHDGDRLLAQNGAGVDALNQTDPALVDMLLAHSADHTPSDLLLPTDISEFPVFIEARDAAMKADVTPGQEPHVADGTYLNGSTAAPSTALPVEPSSNTPLPDHVAGQVGVAADLGGNFAHNGAVIVDTTGAATSLVVRGDSFTTNAIVQVNAYADNDQIAVAGSTSSPFVSSGNDHANNEAIFSHTSMPVDASFGPSYSPLSVQVDMVKGDFLDVKSLTQTNWISDNDVVSQTASSSYSAVITGENDQTTVTKLSDLGPYYDLIVVNGSYHTANLIYQTNVIVDNDVVKVAAGAPGDPADATQSISTGDNSLLNQASISNYGTSAIAAISDNLSHLADKLTAEQPVDAAEWWQIAGSATGFLHVLVVTGDYYNINAISQTNVIGDSDTAIQYVPNVASTGSLTQYLNTGGNSAANVAQIVDLATTKTQFIGGTHYDDSILVQTNLVNYAPPLVSQGAALVPEIAAFTGVDLPDYQHDNFAMPFTYMPVHVDPITHLLS